MLKQDANSFTDYKRKSRDNSLTDKAKKILPKKAVDKMNESREMDNTEQNQVSQSENEQALPTFLFNQ